VFHIFVVDGHIVVLEAMRIVCEQHAGLHFAGGTTSVPEAMQALAKDQPDVMLIDIDLPASMDLLREARDRWPGTGILAHHDGAPSERLREALDLGAGGVVSKSAEIGELVGAIRRAASGGPRTLGATARAPEDERGVALSSRERDVLRLLANGRSNSEIAAELGISPRTVASHVASIYRRLQVATRVEAATMAIRLGISSTPE
jgi:DNA-binding NarL/FixJ family response regulator